LGVNIQASIPVYAESWMTMHAENICIEKLMKAARDDVFVKILTALKVVFDKRFIN
jgi:hypothetical protein